MQLADAKAITRRAYDLGINYFDCARIYWDGKSEEVYGEVLPPFRKKVFLTTKSPERSRKGAEADLEKSLRALKTDYLDLWQIHQVSEMEKCSRSSLRAARSKPSSRRRRPASAGSSASPGITTPKSISRC